MLAHTGGLQFAQVIGVSDAYGELGQMQHCFSDSVAGDVVMPV
jgi:hypothetical protein